ncbi:MAG TPA: FCD domain-containing protein [Chitinolyticbacter sp.]|nr:FCD domain-containing protein [Chitinolyticbacter sp.]
MPIQKPSLVELAVAALRERIAAGEWPLGVRIPTEPELARLLGVSRNTVREAVRVLAFCGVLSVRQGDGTYVASRLDPAQALQALAQAGLAEQLETRAMLEVEAARLAALRRSDADLAALRLALVARGERQPGEALDGFIARDMAFHRAVTAAAHNASLAALHDFCAESIRQALRLTLDDTSLPEPDHATHAAIVDAIAAGDADAAARAARAVIAPTLARLEEGR